MQAIEYVTVKVCCLNAAFDDEAGGRRELARMLRTMADDFEAGGNGGTVRDINGNTCGNIEIQEA